MDRISGRHIFHLGVKELRCILRDPIMLFLIIVSFTFSVYIEGKSMPETLNKAAIVVVDDDNSPLSRQLIDAFYPPYFLPPIAITLAQMDQRMDAGMDTFALHIPTGFERDVLAGHNVTVQLNVDATRMSQAFTGSGYIQAIITAEVTEYRQRFRHDSIMPVELVLHARFNPELNSVWFASVMELVSNITMLAIILAGAALIREREHGTLEHLLVMPVTPLEIMLSKVWAMALIVMLASGFSLIAVVQGVLGVPIAGSLLLFFAIVALNVFAATAMGIFLGSVARSMPQFGLLMFLVLLPLQILSGAMTPFENMAAPVQWVMRLAPTTYFVSLSQAILYRGAGFAMLWPDILIISIIGTVLFYIALVRLRKSLSMME